MQLRKNTVGATSVVFFLKVLANSTKVCYTYDELNRVIKRTVKNLNNEILSEETFTHDAAVFVFLSESRGRCAEIFVKYFVIDAAK